MKSTGTIVPESVPLKNVTSEELDSRRSQLTWKFWKTRRYVVVFMAFLGFINVFALRFNLTIAIVAMTEKFNTTLENGTVLQEQHFNWDSRQQGLILSSFFYGYIWTQILGGVIASKIGGHYVFGVGIGMTALLTLFTPMAAKSSIFAMVAIRVIEGVFEGVAYPAFQDLLSRWTPLFERTRMSSFAYTGAYIGVIFVLPISSLLAVVSSWESIFYFFGATGCIWTVAWMLIIRSSPEKDPWITEEEKKLILKDTGAHRKISHPWKEIFKSTAVWAIIASHFAENYGIYTLMTQLPLFLKDALGFQLAKSGVMSAVPYLVLSCCLPLAGYLADWTQIKGYLTTRQVRRYFNCGAFLMQTVFILLAPYLLHPVWSMICITIAVGLCSCALCGYMVNPLDLAPNHASVIFGFSNTIGTIPGIISPLLTGYVVVTGSVSEWNIVFYVTAGIYIFGSVIYWFFCRAELQPWAQTFTEVPQNDVNTATNKNIT
ncbi:hypothetical protein DMENIID0001_160540 [Sergentomyia squamirostris]